MILLQGWMRQVWSCKTWS